MDCDPGSLACCPPSGCVGNRSRCSAFPRSRTPVGASLPGLQGPVPSSSTSRQCHSPPTVLRVPGHGHRPAHSSEDIEPVVGGSSGSGGDCSLILSPISLESSDLSDATDSPEVGVLISPLEDSSSEVTPAVGYARLPLPSVDNSLIPDLGASSPAVHGTVR